MAVLGCLAGWVAPLTAHAAAPVIDDLTAVPATVAPGSVATVTVVAHDPDCPGTCSTGCGLYVRADLTAWSVDGGSIEGRDDGTSGSPYTATATWRAPSAEGTYTVTVSLSDSGSLLCGGRGTTTGDVSIQVSSDPGGAPAVTSLTASPGLVYSDQAALLACLAEDPDNDLLTFQWTTDLGTLTVDSTGPESSTATLQSDRPGIATVTCTVRDPSGASDSDSVRVAVSDAVAERRLAAGLSAPHRVAIDELGQVYVADRSGGGIQVLSLFSGEAVYRLDLPGVTAVAVDWSGDLLVGTSVGARVIDRGGRNVLVLDLEPGAGPVADVAVDLGNRRYVTVHRTSGRVIVHDASGRRLAAFGAVGDGPAELRSPGGVAVAPGGEIVVADGGHGLIKVFSPLSGTLVRSFGGPGAGVGEFIRLDDVEVGPDGVIWASDSFQDWVQSFDPDGTPRQVVGTYGDGLGELKTAAGVALSGPHERLAAASVNSATVQVFRTGGTAVAELLPQLAYSPLSLVYGSLPVGTAGAPRRVTLTNAGTAPLGVRGLDVSGADFALTGGCPPYLDPGARCVVSVSFAPRAAGVRTGKLLLDTSDADAGGGEPVVVPLSGIGFVPGAMTAVPGALDFPDQPVGTLSPPIPITVSNPGTDPVTVNEIGVSGPFRVSHTCPRRLSGGASCTVSVRFAPDRIGDHLTGTLSLRGGGSTLRVALEGRGVGLDVTAFPGRVDFGPHRVAVSPKVKVITVANTGSDLVEILGALVDGPAPASFAIEEDGCTGRLLWLGEQCSLRVAFTPARGGELDGNLEIASTAPVEWVELRGFGVDAQTLEIPTLDQWGLLALGVLLGLGGLMMLGRRV